MSSTEPRRIARVRILCRNGDGEILLLKWRDPDDGHVFWEPPGGGIEPGEEPPEAAVRELYEETGYTTALEDESFLVDRDYVFASRHHRHTEQFFLTTVAGEPSPAAFSEQEVATFLDARFIHPMKLGSLDAPGRTATSRRAARRSDPAGLSGARAARDVVGVQASRKRPERPMMRTGHDERGDDA